MKKLFAMSLGVLVFGTAGCGEPLSRETEEASCDRTASAGKVCGHVTDKRPAGRPAREK